jgi:hypothetical protein
MNNHKQNIIINFSAHPRRQRTRNVNAGASLQSARQALQKWRLEAQMYSSHRHYLLEKQ